MRQLFLLILCVFLIGCTDLNYYDKELLSDDAEVFSDVLVDASLSPYPPSFHIKNQMMMFGYLDKENHRTLSITYNNEGWTEPQPIKFTDGDEMEAVFSPDGKRLYFSSNENSSSNKPSNLYYVDVIDGGFSKPVRLPDTINSYYVEYYASQTDDGHLYFTREGQGIYKSEYNNGKYLEAEKIEFPREYKYVSHPFIARDESFLLFDARKYGNLGSADLYIAFKTEEGFSEPINLGEKINTKYWDAMAMLSPDYKYLFFSRVGEISQVYWIKFNPEDYR